METGLPTTLPPLVLKHLQDLNREVDHAIQVRDMAVWSAVATLGYADLSKLNVDLKSGEITERV